MDRVERIKSIRCRAAHFINDSFNLSLLEEHIEKDILPNLIEKYNLSNIFPLYKVSFNKLNTYATNHYLDNNLSIYTYSSDDNLLLNRASNVYVISLNELFGNCSTLSISNINVCENNIQSLIMDVSEYIANLFEYTNLMYTTSDDNSSNRNLIPYLEKNNYKVIQEFKNKRGGNIKIFTKII